MESQSEEDKVIAEEYRVWKKNSPFLYDFVLSHALDWPSLTVQWLPDESRGSSSACDVIHHKLVLGTQSDESPEAEANYLMIAEVILPSPDAPVDQRNYNREKDELGSYGGTLSKVAVKVKIVHEGDVHRCRHMPQNSFVIASKSPKADVLVFNYSRHPSTPADLMCRPQHRLKGHSDGGYGLSWNPQVSGRLASASNDGTVCIWDITESAVETQALYTLHHCDTAAPVRAVEDVQWSPLQSTTLASVGDDGRLLVWDIRTDQQSARVVIQAHDADCNCVSFSPHDEFSVATGGSDGVVKLWDLRMPSKSRHELIGHKAGVYQLSWAPFEAGVLASSGEDRRVNIWDTRRIGQEQSAEDAEDGPPELLFIHGGHTAKVFDFSWDAAYPWCLASVAEDNVLQVWQVAAGIYDDEDDADDEDVSVEEDDLEDDEGDDKEDDRRKRQRI